jgi:hypothetical protein
MGIKMSHRRKQMMKPDWNGLKSMNFDRLNYATGIISTREAMIQVLAELKGHDFPMNRVSVFPVNAEQNAEHKKLSRNTDPNQRNITPIEGAKAGAITGGAAGGLLALTVGLGALVVPGVGPALAVESVLSTLLASGTSATFGSVVGAFHGWFAPEKQARFHDSDPAEFWVTIEGTADQIRQAEVILRYWKVREWRVYQSLDST